MRVKLRAHTAMALTVGLLLPVAIAAPARAAAPVVTSFAPTGGAAGTTVTITGSGFTGATAVKFNATSATFTVDSDTQITTSVPSGATTGPISVTTSQGTGTSSSNFTVTIGIAGFSPTVGAAGNCINITGSGFTGATEVKFNAVAATVFTVVSDGAILATVPAAATTGPISVTAPSGTVTSSGSFTVGTTSTTICSFAPTTGAIGAAVTVTGTNFTGATALRFGATTATFTVDSATQISTTVPAGSITGKISVTTPSGTATSATDFIVQQPPNAPSITSFSPTTGPIGTLVVITGTGFNNLIAVKFNGISASFTRNSNQELTTTVPAGASTGKITVQNDNGTGISAQDFTVTESAPTITSFSPTSGPPGATVFINGSDFTSTTTVTFNGVSAAFTVNSSTAITATVPAGATTGPISVTNAAGTGTSPQPFTVTASSPPPTITSFSPTGGAPGTTVTITGTNFGGATAVKFSATPANFTVTSDTQINTTVPAGAATGPLSVTTPSGTATSGTNFTVTAAEPHSRSVTLSLVKALVAKGKVTVADAFAACVQNVPVKVQRRVSGRWKTIARTSTDGAGSYKATIANRAGKYRAVAPQVTVGVDVCAKARSRPATV